jgi:hypothetical protein
MDEEATMDERGFVWKRASSGGRVGVGNFGAAKLDKEVAATLLAFAV